MTLQVYVFRQLLTAFTVAVGGMLFIALPGIAVKAFHKFAGASMAAVLGFMPMALVELVPYLIPIAFLLAVVATYGRLASDNEWTAIMMAGISPWRMMLPGVVLSLALGGGTYWIESTVSPRLQYLQRDYAKNTVKRSLRRLAPGRTELRFGGFYLAAKYRDHELDLFRDVFIYVPKSRSEEARTVLASSAQFVFTETDLIVYLTDAQTVHGSKQGFVEYMEVERALDDLFPRHEFNARSWKYSSTPRLLEMIENGEIDDRNLRKALFEYHRRHSLAATCLVFLLLGAPTGLLLRRGTQLSALAAGVGYALLYYIVSLRFGKTLGNAGSVPEWVGAWSANGIGLVLSPLLFLRAFRR